MPFIPVPNGALVEIRMSLDNQKVENTLWFAGTVIPTAAQLLTLGGLIHDWWVANYAPLVANTVSLREIYVTSQNTANGPTATITPSSAETGALTSPALPNNVSLTVSFRTALRGRSYRGRNYVIGLTEAQVDLSEVQQTIVDDWIAAYEAVGAAVSGSGFTWVVASRFSGVDSAGHPIPRDAGVTEPITAVAIVDRVVDSQRRRLPGRGQ